MLMDMNTPIRMLWLAAVVCLAGAVRGQEPTYDLRPIWTDGQTARYRGVTDRHQVVEMQLPGGEAGASESMIHSEILMTWRVEEANPEGGGWCALTIDEITVELTAGDGEMHRLTHRDGGHENPILDIVAKRISAMAGTPVEVEIAPDGRVESVRGVEKMRRKYGAASESIEDRDFREAATSLAGIVGAGGEVEPGETWEEQFTWGHELGELDFDTTFELIGVERIAGIEVVTVATEADLDLEPKMPGEMPPGASVDVDLTEGRETTQAMFDLSRHEVVGQNIDRTLSVDMTITINGRTLSRSITETVNSQVLRIAEE